MKRIPAAFFILLANMVLFVHAVVPHHHHDSDLCFDTFVAEHTSHENCCSTACNAGQHQHDSSDEESDSCMLSHIVALFNGDIKQNIRAHISSHDLVNNAFLFAIESSESSSVSNPHFFIEIVFNDHIPIYHSLASQAFGLRAPPSFC